MLSIMVGSHNDCPPDTMIKSKYTSSYLCCDTHTYIYHIISNTHDKEHHRATCASNSATYTHTSACTIVYATHDTGIDANSTAVTTTDTSRSMLISNHTTDSVNVATCTSNDDMHD